MSAPLASTLDEISAEVARARLKFPRNTHLTHALGEEFGELCQAQLQGRPAEQIRREAMQVACLAIRIMEEGDADFSSLTAEEMQP